MINRTKYFLTIAFLLITAQAILADFYRGGWISFLTLERSPHARKEAMGKTGVASRGYMYAESHNPACISGIGDFAVNYSFDPDRYYTSYDDDKWFSHFFAAGIQHDEYSIVISRYAHDYGVERISWVDDPEGKYYDFRSALYSLSLAGELMDCFTFGVSMQMVDWDLGTLSEEQDFFFNAGLLYKMPLIANNELQDEIDIGLSMTNILNGEAYGNVSEHAPQCLRFGFNNKTVFNDTHLNSIEICAEVNKILNSKTKKEDFIFGTGMEMQIYKYLFFRCGYFYDENDDHGYPQYTRDYVSDFTYGAGLKLPIGFISRSNYSPSELCVDFTQLPQPTASRSYSFDDFYNFSFTLKWDFNN